MIWIERKEKDGDWMKICGICGICEVSVCNKQQNILRCCSNFLKMRDENLFFYIP